MRGDFRRAYFSKRVLLFSVNTNNLAKAYVHMDNKEYREMKGYEQSGYNFQNTPIIVLKKR